MKETESNQVKLLRKAWVKFGYFYKGTNDVFFIGWMEMNRGWSWRFLTGTNLEHIIRILSNSTQKELAIAQMLSLQKFARGAVKYHVAWMKNGIGIHWKAILTSWRWMLQGISNCIFHRWFPKTSPDFFFDSVIEILLLLPSLCTQLAPSGISSTFFVHTAGSIWWTGSVEEKLNLDNYDLIF